jgi:hypothetical protein
MVILRFERRKKCGDGNSGANGSCHCANGCLFALLAKNDLIILIALRISGIVRTDNFPQGGSFNQTFPVGEVLIWGKLPVHRQMIAILAIQFGVVVTNAPPPHSTACSQEFSNVFLVLHT